MKVGADPIREDRATAIMWIIATLFLIPLMVGFGVGVAWVADATYAYFTAIVPAVIVVVGDVWGIVAMARRQRSARYPRTGLIIGIGVLVILVAVAALADIV